jgi:hypothetical protein
VPAFGFIVAEPGPAQRGLDHHVAGQQDIRVAQGPHAQVPGRPRPDSAQREQLPLRLLAVGARIEPQAAVGQRTADRPQRRLPGLGHAELGEVGLGQRRADREQMRQPAARLPQRLAASGDEPARQPARRGDRDLLPEHGPDRHLVRLGGADRTQAGALHRERAEDRIRREVLADRDRIRVEVEQPPHPADGRGEPAQVGEVEPALQPRPAGGPLAHLHDAGPVLEPQGPPIDAVPRLAEHLLDPGDRTGGEEVEDVPARIGLAVGEPQRNADAAVRAVAALELACGCAQRGRRRGVHLADGVVELPHAGEPRRERDVRGGQRSGLQQHPRGVRTLRTRQRERPRAELGDQVPLHLPLAVTEARGKPAHALAVDHPVVDQPHRPPDDVRPQVPLRGPGHRVRPAAPAGPEPARLRRRRGRVEPDVLPLRRGRRAARPAVDPGAGDGGEEHAVEARVAPAHRLVAVLVGQRRGGGHGSMMRPVAAKI